MIISSLEKMLKMDESDGSSEYDVEKKYNVLENNYRCLLGVTSVLTEALENTVRGYPFDLEDALNQCMKIYPGLFTVQPKRIRTRPIKNHKIYTTPASDFTDIGDSYDIENRDFKLITELQKPTVVIGNDDRNSVNVENTTHLALRIKRNSTSSQMSDMEYLKPKDVIENRIFSRSNSQISQTNENAYTVKHPESDGEQQRRNSYSNRSITNNLPQMDNFDQTEIKIFDSNNLISNHPPYEIVVQQHFQQIETADSKGDIVIKIKPDITEIVENLQDNTQSKNITAQNFTNTPRKSIISNPLETCIIITNHMNGEVHNEQHKYDSNNVNDDMKRVINYFNDDEDVLPGSSTDVAMDKLQKLSTGLKVQKDVMQTMALNKEESIKKSSGMLTTSECINKSQIYGITYGKEDVKNHYEKLKNEMLNSSVKDSATSLQNLRLKLIHSLAKERAELITRYVENDILDVNKDVTLIEKLLPKEIVNGWDLILQQIILKFINTMCSIWKGREYITSNINIISCLKKYFFEKYKHRNMSDTISQDMLIAIIHKMSTKLNQHSVLLSTGLLEKIFHSVSEGNETMPLYRLKHSLGILINMCVYEYGRNALESVKSEMLNLLISLLNKKDKRIIPFVARLIYVLMANETFHKKAKEMNLVENLEKTINPANKRLQLQLDVLKSVIEEPEPHKYLNGTEENFLANIEAEMDELEEEVEVGEPFLTNGDHDNKQCKTNIKESPIRMKPQNNKEINKSSTVSKVEENKKPSYINKNKKKVQSKIAVRKKDVVESTVREKPIIKRQRSKIGEQKKEVQPKPAVKEDKISETKKQVSNNLKSNNIHEIIESFDEMATSYIILNDPITSDVIKADLNVQTDEKQFSNKAEEDLPIKTLSDTDPNANINMDNNTSFVLLSENESSKSASIDLNLNISSESSDSPKKIDDEINNKDDISSDNLIEERPSGTSNSNYLMVHSRGSPKVSLFIQHGKITAIDYDYCEDTKEIQSPIKHGNIFKDRQSPYKDLLKESKRKFKTQPTTRIRQKITKSTKSENDKETQQKIEILSSSLNEINKE